MAKASTKQTDPTAAQQQLIAIMAIERTGMVLREQMGKTKVKLPPGGYPVALTIDITGDVIKGANYTTASKQGPSFTADELLVAMCVGKSSTEIREMLVEAIDALRRGETPAGKATIAAATTAVRGFVEEIAKERHLWKTTKGQAKKGPVTGKPRVVVEGTVGVNDSDLSVSVTVNEEKPKQAA